MLPNKAIHLTRHRSFTDPFYSFLAAAHSVQVMASVGVAFNQRGKPMIRCSMTGRPMEGPSDGIYDDGEWISWDWINQQLYKQDLKSEYPHVDPDLAELFESLVENAAAYHAMTGRYLQIWGELGELYAEVKYGVRRHKPKTPGSDGRLGNDYVEVKTISPEKSSDQVQVKRSGNFNKLLVVKITEDFRFESKMLDRKNMSKGEGTHARVNWSSIPSKPQRNSDT